MRTRVGVVLAVWIALAAAPHASAATFGVTRTDDPTPGACDADCSLREAVRAANAGTGGDTIVLPAGHFRLGIAGVGEAAAASGDLDLTRSVSITGAGARSTVVDAMGLDRVFDVASGITVEISDLEITGGLVAAGGAGIENAGTLTLLRDAIVGNRATGVNNGGGIDSAGPALTVTQSTIAGNQAYNGGGINFGNSLTVTASTIAGNVAGGPGLNGDGGGIEGSAGATLVIRSATITGNHSFNGASSGGGILSSSVTVQNTIVAGNVAHEPDQSASYLDNCSSATTSQGNNLSDGADCGFTQPGDRQSATVLLGPLADNGGPTDTEALPPGSAARDAGAGCAAPDQRGVSRPRGGACDIGAYEVAAPLVTTGAAGSILFTGATLKGTVDPSLRDTSAYFEYGTTTAYGLATPAQTVGSGNGPVPVSAAVAGLRQGVTYHFRLVATNADGAAAGADQTLTTLDQTPPKLTLLRVLPGLFHRRVGARISFRLSEAATVTFNVDRVLRGVKRHGRCVARKRRVRGRACTRYLPVTGSFFKGGGEGANLIDFDARVGGRLLLPGAYRLRATARDASGNTGKIVVAAFRVLR